MGITSKYYADWIYTTRPGETERFYLGSDDAQGSEFDVTPLLSDRLSLVVRSFPLFSLFGPKAAGPLTSDQCRNLLLQSGVDVSDDVGKSVAGIYWPTDHHPIPNTQATENGLASGPGWRHPQLIGLVPGWALLMVQAARNDDHPLACQVVEVVRDAVTGPHGVDTSLKGVIGIVAECVVSLTFYLCLDFEIFILTCEFTEL
ncbi:unnamed protein product [Protopolystoma xenopodis]|uniref:Uncharacterized protein n=1 Tax=Protopolystoma xenopodis TaxID=117903 RepID=A0A3S4ZMT5_9PLAT|nr:unnamed protein product [Protopolystoma xenopodis]